MPETSEFLYERELRLAVVMYGGVSLAIYMNGVSQELLHMVRATAADPADPGRARYTDKELTSSALVYRQLARLGVGGGDQGVRPEETQAPIRQRFVIDILSGTSAGGINAVFLAKALANSQSLDGLARLWQSEADIGLLINDAESRRQISDLPGNRKPKSLLNSQRMYRKLLDAFDEMDKSSPAAGKLVDDVDLFVTATDLGGLPIRLQLGGGEVAEERRYRKSFHLARVGNRNDFERVDNPFLAFIARCTSSFPVAFEPMQFATVTSLLKPIRRQLFPQAGAAGAPEPSGIPDRWKRHFDEYDSHGSGLTAPFVRPFADGGYLDNKPFSYAIDAIVERRGGDSGSVERKLVYIEPDPERLSPPRDEGAAEPPNAIDNALAVIRLRSYETIREELLRLRDRNRLVDKIRSVVAGVDSDFEALGNLARGALSKIIADRAVFGERALDQVVSVFGSAYGGYHRLKVGQLTDELSQIVATHSGISPASDEFRAIRLLVRGWRNARYTPNPAGPSVDSKGDKRQSEFSFLRAFDLSYRIRRASFVIAQINRLGVLTPKELAAELGKHPSICGGPIAVAITAEDPPELRRTFGELRREFAGVVRDLRSARETLLSPEPDAMLKVIADNANAVRRTASDIMAEPTERRRWEKVDDLVRVNVDLNNMLEKMQKEIGAQVEKASEPARKRCWDLLETDGRPQLLDQVQVPKSPEEVAKFIGRHYYTWYELYDSMLFPITYGSEVGEEIATVEPIRISPLTGRDDAGLSVPNPKLMPAGIAVGHFGAFLSPEWRAWDILIGRMNAAEKLIRMVLAGTPHDRPEVADKFIDRAHKAILEEECARKGSIVGQRLSAIQNVNTAEDRLAFLKEDGLQLADLSPAHVVGWMARAAKVMGRVFREASERRSFKRIATWLLYSGQLLTGLIEVLMPRQWWGLMLRLWIPRLLVFAAALIILGPLLSKDQVTGLGWTVIWLVVGFATLTFLLQSLIDEGRGSRVFRAITSLVALAIIALLVIGIAYSPDAARAFQVRVWAWLGL